tara:strand:+ start:21 stop:881 length:861 start_codon:yes stop_codon:yes gene_type:complete
MRVFAFGCSLTQYFYPTWADILIHDYKVKNNALGENWGRSGAGNQYIATRIWEANTVHSFTKDDVILLQWTSMFREDRYHMGSGWHTPGNFSKSSVNNDAFVLNNYRYQSQWQWADLIWATMRDCALISSTHKALESIGCKVISTGFRDVTEGWEEQSLDFNLNNKYLELEDVRAVLEKYKTDISTSCPPILNALNFNVTDDFFESRPVSVPSPSPDHEHMKSPEVHPLTHEYATFITNEITTLSNETLEFVDKWKQTLSADPILLYELDWFNSDRYGWADDRWRP